MNSLARGRFFKTVFITFVMFQVFVCRPVENPEKHSEIAARLY